MQHHDTPLEVIRRRRTIRKFHSDPVPDNIVQELLEAGMCAPSAGDEKPWFFLAITERTILDKMAVIHPYALMMSQVPVAIVVCCDMNHDHLKNHAVLGCAAATQNILLAAEANKLGAAWLGIYPEADRIANFKKLFDLPDHIMPFALIPVGHPGEEKLPKGRFDASRIRYNKW
ncbi:MAG: nitroreductase family protein [bacterium]